MDFRLRENGKGKMKKIVYGSISEAEVRGSGPHSSFSYLIHFHISERESKDDNGFHMLPCGGGIAKKPA
jgi:hypothetical protein